MTRFRGQYLGISSALIFAFTFAIPAQSEVAEPGGRRAPSIYSIEPNSGPPGIQATIIGYGFLATNIVHFGKEVIPDIPIAWQAGITCGQNKPMCHPGINQALVIVIPQNVDAGGYDVFVETATGRSNIVTFTVVYGRGKPRR